MRIIETGSPEETFNLARKMGVSCEPGTVIALDGDLGTGKTVFAKGFAAGLGVEESVSSPTFTIMKQYSSGRLPLYHFDVYRIGDASEMDETGFEDCVCGEGVTLVEWAEEIKEVMPYGTIWITIEKEPEKGFDHRKVTIEDEHTGD